MFFFFVSHDFFFLIHNLGARPASFLQTYMLMIGAPAGDLVQFVKTGAGRGSGRRGAAENEKDSRATAGDVLVSRVELDCRTYRHREHWEGTILPRLYEFARMVYRFRGDDLRRWRYLLAAPVRREGPVGSRQPWPVWCRL